MLQSISWYHNLLVFLNHLRSSAALSYKWRTCVNHLHLAQMLSLSCPRFPGAEVPHSALSISPPPSLLSLFSFLSFLPGKSFKGWMICNYAGNTERESSALRGCQKTSIELHARPSFIQPFNSPINYTVNKDYFHGESKCNPDNLAGNHTSSDQGQSHYDKLCD